MAASQLRIIIDGGYLFKVFSPYARAGYRQSLGRLARLLSLNYTLRGIEYVNSINNRDQATREKQERFYYDYLRDKLGWNVHILPLQWPGGKAEQKGTDSTITLRLVELAAKNEYETVILLAADSDFCPPVESVKEQGKIVRNAYFSARPSYHLQKACNGPLIRLDDLDFVYKDGDPRTLLRLANIKKP